ncbi:gamma-glutamylcyclotransferase [Spirosoma aerophilum]
MQDMYESTSDLDQLIKALNKHKQIAGVTLNNLDESGLTEREKDFIRLYKPETSLIIYGTLAPNKPNHSVVEHIRGEWQRALVKGKLENKGWGAELGYYGFKHADRANQTDIEAFILLSDELVANWAYLDDFEGDGYTRVLAAYTVASGETGVGYIYAINEP